MTESSTHAQLLCPCRPRCARNATPSRQRTKQRSRNLQTAGWREKLAGRWQQGAAYKTAAPVMGQRAAVAGKCPLAGAASSLELGRSRYSNI